MSRKTKLPDPLHKIAENKLFCFIPFLLIAFPSELKFDSIVLFTCKTQPKLILSSEETYSLCWQ